MALGLWRLNNLSNTWHLWILRLVAGLGIRRGLWGFGLLPFGCGLEQLLRHFGCKLLLLREFHLRFRLFLLPELLDSSFLCANLACVGYNRFMEKSERIAKRMASAGLCSRREAESWILDGRVKVNGVVLETPAFKVCDTDEIFVDGWPLAKQVDVKLFKYYKPTGVLCTTKDPQGRPTVFDRLPKNLPRLVLVGRLDLNSEGLLLLTTSGELADKLMKGDLPRVYKIRVRGEVTDSQIKKLAAGITVEGMRYKPITVVAEDGKKGGSNKWYKVTLTEGKNREIRNVFASIGHEVNRLIRLSYGDFVLGEMNRGEVLEVAVNG